MRILVLNCGSSSVKYKLLDLPAGSLLAEGAVERVGGSGSAGRQTGPRGKLLRERPVPDPRAAVRLALEMLTDPERGAVASASEIEACGHRVVHGGERFTRSVVVDGGVERGIEENAGLAPLHNPPNLTGIREARRALPGAAHVACFDTAFHHTLPERAHLYALPYELYERRGIRRYGFHGASHQYVTERAAAWLGRPVSAVSLVSCHLGNGCSVTAVENGRSVDTTMGFTPLEGLMMGTRSGSFDPAVLLHLLRGGESPESLEEMVNRRSGLLGISGVSNDVRDLEAAAARGVRRARLALDMFAYRVRKAVGAALAVLGECHAVVMTGGIGEHSAPMRSTILSGLDRLGVRLDGERNEAGSGREGSVADDASPVKILVIPTDEELFIARETYRAVRRAGEPDAGGRHKG